LGVVMEKNTRTLCEIWIQQIVSKSIAKKLESANCQQKYRRKLDSANCQQQHFAFSKYSAKIMTDEMDSANCQQNSRS
jgi:hypothetical protein